MAQVTVFVDDAVRGTLPAVCAKDGVPTADRLTVHTTVGDGARLGVLWLLVFAGPIGWIVLLVLSTSRSGQAERLRVDLPVSAAAYQRVLDARSNTRRAMLTALGGLALLVLSISAQDPLDAVLAIGGGVALVVGLLGMALMDSRRQQASIDVALDASRRWVTLHRVHPAFVAACEAHRQRAGHPTP